MKSWFSKREYPEDLVSSEMRKVIFFQKSNNKNHSMKGIPLVITYHSLLKPLTAIIDNNLSILCTDKEVKRVFTSQPMV